MFKIVRREEMSGGTVILNEIEAPRIAVKARPGQFLILKANEDGERIPLTMAETDPVKGTVTVIYMVVGKSTELFRACRSGTPTRTSSAPWASRRTSKAARTWSVWAEGPEWRCCTPSPGA